MNSKAIVKLAQNLSYKQIEFYPNWRILGRNFDEGKVELARK